MSQNNLKYILIVIILAAITGGTVYIWQYFNIQKGKSKISERPEIKTSQNQEIGVKGYINGNKGKKLYIPFWVIETVDSEVLGINSIAFDLDNHPYIAYKDQHNSLKWARYDGSKWVRETIDPGITGSSIVIALDSNNNPHFSYWDMRHDNLRYARQEKSKWKSEVIDSVAMMGSISMAVDSDNHPHIIYFSCQSIRNPICDLKYVKHDGSRWIRKTIYSGENLGAFNSMALDSNNTPHVSYSADSEGIKYAKRTESGWVIETVDPHPIIGGQGNNSIALDSHNLPHISYYIGYNGEDFFKLKYAKYDGSKWIIETIESFKTRAAFRTSIVLDSRDDSHISYYADESLKYTKWGIEVVDSGLEAGYNSMVLDSNNLPHISYWDREALNDVLKYGHQEFFYRDIVEGDTLWELAQEYLKDGLGWREIYELNKENLEEEAQKRGFESALIYRNNLPIVLIFP